MRTSTIDERECKVVCRVLVTANEVNVDPDVFFTANSNGLVYDGRLIVDEHFRTVDPAIYAGGSMCEYSRTAYSDTMMMEAASGRYGRSLLRHDGYNGEQVG